LSIQSPVGNWGHIGNLGVVLCLLCFVPYYSSVPNSAIADNGTDTCGGAILMLSAAPVLVAPNV